MAKAPTKGQPRPLSATQREAIVRRVPRFRFMSETWNELKRVTWPSRQEATRLTIIVLMISLAIGLALSLVDSGFTRLFDRLILG